MRCVKKSAGFRFLGVSISKIIFISLFFMIVMMNLPMLISALPPLPTEFYGVIRDYNYNGSPGEVVQAYDSDGVLCGSFTIVNSGFYGSLTCKGDDPETPVDEGATAGENITFKYKGGFTTVMGNNTWGYGVFQYVNLTYPVVYCGDNFCDAWYENNYNCPEDCPSYNASVNITTNVTNISGGGGAGEGGEGEEEAGGEETGGGYLGLMPSFYLNYTGFNVSEYGVGYECKEKWVCSNWSVCRIDGFQNRTCVDENNCGTYEEKPPEIQRCVYTPTCFDGVKNGLEEGIDCGGLCPPCITCFDGIQNCHDGLCEEGIDCGGPCEKKCPGIQVPKPLFVCKKDFNPLTNQSILFFILIILIILGDIIYSKNKIDDIKKKKKLSDIKRAREIFSIKRRMYLFIFITVLISVILYLYYYFFIMCEVEYRFLWLLLILLFISPLVIHQIIRYFEYTEQKRLKKLEALLETHYKQIENLIRIENENLAELEQEIADELYRLLEKPEYREKEISGADEIKVLREIYKELVLLYSKYRERENPLADEKVLCDDIYRVLEEEKYKSLIQRMPELRSVSSKLKLLYKQYEEKQKLYEELNKVESSKQELEEAVNDKVKEEGREE